MTTQVLGITQNAGWVYKKPSCALVMESNVHAYEVMRYAGLSLPEGT